jgi:UDP-3-O-[3-hydroxymyristoyl] glucosamine N-acyltransferase
VGGRLEGDGDLLLQHLAPLDRAGPDALTVLLTPKYLAAFRATRAGAVLLPEGLAGEPGGPTTRIIVAAPDEALAEIAAAFTPGAPRRAGIDPAARIADDAVIGEGSSVGPFAVIENGARVGARAQIGSGACIGAGATLGDDCVIGPNAVCYAGATLGARVVLKAGAIVGGPGFGYLRDGDGHRRTPHLGGCILEDDVEIGSGACVDRGSFDDTIVGRGTKIDNLVQIAHNVHLGARCLVMATSGIAGSCRIGNDVVIAGGVGVADHVRIGDGAVIGAKSVVFGPGTVPAGAVVTGYPARPHRAFLRGQAALYRLAAIIDDLETISAERREHAADGRSSG